MKAYKKWKCFYNKGKVKTVSLKKPLTEEKFLKYIRINKKEVPRYVFPLEEE